MYDYQGRSYLHVPQDVGTNLRSVNVPDKCYLPKKQIHVWSGHTKVSTNGQCVAFVLINNIVYVFVKTFLILNMYYPIIL